MTIDYSRYVDDDDTTDTSEIFLDGNEVESNITTDTTSHVATDIVTDTTEHMILSYLRASHQLWIRCSHIIHPDYFSVDSRKVIELLTEFELKNKQMPDILVVSADTGISLDTPDDANDITIIDDMSHRVEEFCIHRAATDFLIESADTISKDRSKDTIAHLVSEMQLISQISVKQDMGYEAHRDMKALLDISKDSDQLPMGLDLLDDALGGGVTEPSYNLVSAASGEGKSIFLANLALNYSATGHNVVYISLELPEFMIGKRMAAMMTETNISSIYQEMDKVVFSVTMRGKKNGYIQLKRMPMVGVTVAAIRAYVDELSASTDKIWDRIIIDYPDLMSSMRTDIREDNIHLKDKAVSAEIYDWAHDRTCPKIIWGASQQVKGAKDEKLARQSGVSGGVGKVETCDVLIILKRSTDDYENNICWAFIEKGRNGGTGMRVPIKWDTKTQKMVAPMSLRDECADMLDEPPDYQKTVRKRPDPLVETARRTSDELSEKTQQLLHVVRQRGKTND